MNIYMYKTITIMLSIFYVGVDITIRDMLRVASFLVVYFNIEATIRNVLQDLFGQTAPEIRSTR